MWQPTEEESDCSEAGSDAGEGLDTFDAMETEDDGRKMDGLPDGENGMENFWDLPEEVT